MEKITKIVFKLNERSENSAIWFVLEVVDAISKEL